MVLSFFENLFEFSKEEKHSNSEILNISEKSNGRTRAK